jgi:arginyl-tRNA synthetase
MGDVALPCFSFARELKKAPPQIAADIAESIKPNEYISQIVAT